MFLSPLRQTVLGAALSIVFTVPTAHAAVLAIDFSNTTGSPLVSSSAFTLGWSFTALDSITVTDLGLFDDSQNGLAESHDIGLWNSAGTLLVSTTLASGTSAPLLGKFRFASVAPTSLSAGQTYRIGALFGPTGEISDSLIFSGDALDFVTSSDIAFIQSQEIEAAVLTDPTNSFSPDPAYFGPNFLYTIVPVPGAVWLFGSALGVMALARRKLAS